MVDFPMTYPNDNDCCDSPDARKRKVTAIFSSTDIALQKIVSSFVILFVTKQMMKSFRRHPNVPIEEV